MLRIVAIKVESHVIALTISLLWIVDCYSETMRVKDRNNLSYMEKKEASFVSKKCMRSHHYYQTQSHFKGTTIHQPLHCIKVSLQNVFFPGLSRIFSPPFLLSRCNLVNSLSPFQKNSPEGVVVE